MGVDPITVEVLKHRLIAVAEQMTISMVRAAHSPALREAKDCSSCLFDEEGRLIAQAADMPMHVGSMAPTLKMILRTLQSHRGFRPGDLLVTNAPYIAGTGLGSNHLADYLVYAPVFVDKVLSGFSGTMAHHHDFGGSLHGSIGQADDLFGEGTIVPPIWLRRGKSLNLGILDMIFANSRTPATFRGDLQAQIAACEFGQRQLESIVARYGRGHFATLVGELLEYAERRMRASVREIPSGVYGAEDVVDDDGAIGGPYVIKVSVEVEGDAMTIDYHGTAPQVSGSINAPLITTYAATYIALHNILDPHCPSNDGTYRPFAIVAPEGSLVNPRAPAACLGRIVTCHRIVDAIQQALAPAVPQRVTAGSHGCSHIIGFKFKRGEVAMDVAAGGIGGRPGRDGLGGMCNHLQNFTHISVEQLEMAAPLRMLTYEFIPDSGGPGLFRGGLGIVRKYELLEDASINIQSDRHVVGPYGLFCGRRSAPTRWAVLSDAGTKVLRSKETKIHVRKGEAVVMELAGGGGYGDPLSRPPQRVLQDVIEGKVTPEVARLEYGVVIDVDRLRIDMEETQRLRVSIKGATNETGRRQ